MVSDEFTVTIFFPFAFAFFTSFGSHHPAPADHPSPDTAANDDVKNGDDDDDDDDGDILANTGSSDAMQSDQQSSVESSEIAPTSAGDTNADILKAAFAEDADDDDTPH